MAAIRVGLDALIIQHRLMITSNEDDLRIAQTLLLQPTQKRLEVPLDVAGASVVPNEVPHVHQDLARRE